jgi:hypothetical protein
MIAVETVYEPDPQRQVRLEERYVLHCRISDALAPLWPAIGALAP